MTTIQDLYINYKNLPNEKNEKQLFIMIKRLIFNHLKYRRFSRNLINDGVSHILLYIISNNIVTKDYDDANHFYFLLLKTIKFKSINLTASIKETYYSNTEAKLVKNITQQTHGYLMTINNYNSLDISISKKQMDSIIRKTLMYTTPILSNDDIYDLDYESTFDLYHKKIMYKKITTLVSLLPISQKQIYCMLYVQNIKQSEIHKILNVSRQNITERVNTLHAKLKSLNNKYNIISMEEL